MGLTTGDTAATGASVAAVATPEAPPSCAELKKNNETQRTNAADSLKSEDSLTKPEQEALDKAEGTGMTVSTALSTVPGQSGVMAGCSSGVARAANPNGLVNGGTSAQKMGAPDKDGNQPGTLCDGSYTHTQGGAGGHAEAKILNEMGPTMGGGSLTFSIDWRFTRGGQPQQSGMPCKQCLKALCHTAKVCKIEIFICDYKNEPQKLTDNDCNAADKNSYRNLCKKIDNNPLRAGR